MSKSRRMRWAGHVAHMEGAILHSGFCSNHGPRGVMQKEQDKQWADLAKTLRASCTETSSYCHIAVIINMYIRAYLVLGTLIKKAASDMGT
jgi:hypothetical protein